MRRISLTILFLFAGLYQYAHSETIKLKSGRSINAPIIDRQHDHIKVNLSGVDLTYYKDEIESIQLDQVGKPYQHDIQKSTDRIAQLINQVSNSVVVIHAQKNTSTTVGTGFFISSDGLIVTNFHVIFKSQFIKIKTKSGATYPVQFIVNANEDLDICILKINITNAPALPLGDSDTLRSGQIIFTIGHREGSEYETSSGPYIGKRTLDEETTLQSKLVTGHGNSGGPILDQQGSLVGISKAFSEETGYNFGIPINAAKIYFKYDNPVTVAVFNEQFSQADEITYSGFGLLLSGEYAKALDNFRQAIDLEPHHLKAWVGSAKTYSLMSQEQEALNAWTEVNKLDPLNVLAYVRLGKIFLNRNQIDKGLIYLKKAAELAPRTNGIYSDLGFAYGQKGLTSEAIKAYQKAIELDPQDGANHYNLAVAYFNKRDFLQARKHCDTAKKSGYIIPDSFLNQLAQSEKLGNILEIKYAVFIIEVNDRIRIH